MTEKGDSWILVLDDDPLVTRTMQTLLGEETSLNVATFNHPSDALASLDDREYQVVVSDFVMPGMDGIEFLKRVREQQPSTSRILLTGYADKQNAIRAINEAGLYYYFEKPWDNEKLVMVLHNAVERARLVRELDSKMAELVHRDNSLEELRARLLKAIL
jgi:DNA-binding NtrC family response regulator